MELQKEERWEKGKQAESGSSKLRRGQAVGTDGERGAGKVQDNCLGSSLTGG